MSARYRRCAHERPHLKEAGMKGWREHAADVFADQCANAAEMKFARGLWPPRISSYSTTPYPTNGVRPYGVSRNLSLVFSEEHAFVRQSRGETPVAALKIRAACPAVGKPQESASCAMGDFDDFSFAFNIATRRSVIAASTLLPSCSLNRR